MTIADLDKNFQIPDPGVPVEWIDANDSRFSLHGITYDEEAGRYRRMPQAVASTVNPGVSYFSKYSTGGRLRFKTNSPYIAIKCVLPPEQCLPHMPFTGTHGFSLYINGKFTAVYHTPVKEVYDNIGKPFAMQVTKTFNEATMRSHELYFPLYNGVIKLYIGVKPGSKILPHKPYKYKKPVVFYGSSITHGGCPSRTGNDYVSHLSRMLNTDYINLGFSGNAKGEQTMANYIASIDANVFVIDYDHNSPTYEHLEQTHYPLYQTIRAKNPNTPIVIISSPNPEFMKRGFERRDLIKANYEKAVASGDKNVYFVDGETLLGKSYRDACTVDCCHPNDLGFLRMAKTIRPVLKKALESTK